LGWSWVGRFLRRGSAVGPQRRQSKCYGSGVFGLAEMHSLAVEGWVGWVMTEINLIRTRDSVPTEIRGIAIAIIGNERRDQTGCQLHIA
jgi:hypothetical protein